MTFLLFWRLINIKLINKLNRLLIQIYIFHFDEKVYLFKMYLNIFLSVILIEF